MEMSHTLAHLANRWVLKNPNLELIPDSEDYPWFVVELQRQLKALDSRGELLLPNLKNDNESIAIFSDYGGESKDAKYHTYSFLICAWNQLDPFLMAMGQLRKQTGLDNPLKEIAYKDLHYGPVQRALSGYLNHLSNFVNGLLLTVVVDKDVGSVYGTDKKNSQQFIVKTLSDHGFGELKPAVAEKMMRIVHFSAYLVALLSRDGQKIFWMTDHDSIAPNSERHMQTLSVFNSLLAHYSKHGFSMVGGALPFVERLPMWLDLLSAPDIVAGSVEHYMSRRKIFGEQFTITEHCNKVLTWLAVQGIGLKRHTVIIRKERQGVVSSTLKFILKEPLLNANVVPVFMPPRPEKLG
jgi:hypothetical protein